MSLFIAVFLVAGCHEPEAGMEGPPIDGIRITDLAPRVKKQTPVRTVFRVFTFEVPAEEMQSLGELFESMSKRQIRYADRAVFDGNGFRAGFGSQSEWGSFSAAIQAVASRTTNTRNVVAYELEGDELMTATLKFTEQVAWIGPRDAIVRNMFTFGRFSWMIKARRTGGIRGLAEVTIVPAYKLGTQDTFSQVDHFEDRSPFASCALDVRMSPGDYLLLGSTGEPTGGDGLGIGPLTLTRLLFYSVDRPGSLKVYLILCVGVED